MLMDNPFSAGPSSLDWSCNVKKSYKICCLPGDCIGPEIMAEGKKVLAAVGQRFGVEFVCEDALIGGAEIDACGTALPDEVLKEVKTVGDIVRYLEALESKAN